jgi:hypothetical protein
MAAFQKAIDAIDRTTSLSFTDSSQPIQVAVGDLSGVSISVSGTFTGSLAFEGSVSGTSWSAIAVYRLSDNTESATITTAGQYGINSTAFSQIKIVPTIESGTAVVELLAVKSNLLMAPAAGSGESTTIDLGNKIDTATMPTGGVGLLGWVSGAFKALGDIFQLLSDRFPALVSGRIPVQVSSLNVTVDNASLEIANDAGNPIPVSGTVTANTGLSQPLTDTQLRASAVPISGTVAISNSSLEISNDVGNPVPVTGTFWQATQPVSASSLPLPSGAATSGLQTTANTSLSNIDTKTPALGQALAAASTPVVLPDAQITALTPLSTIAATQSGNWNIGSITTLPSLPTGANTIGAISNTAFSITGTLPAFAATPTFNIGTAPSLTFTNTSFTANAGSNLNTSALALESGGNLAGINSKLPSNLTVSATRLLVDGSGITQPVSMATAPTGLAYVASTLVTRPANVTPYTANDVYGGVFEIQNIGASGGFIFIESIDIIFNITAVPSGMSSFTVYLYGVTPPSAIADNLAFSISSGDRASIMNPRGITLSASLAQGGGSVVAEVRNLNQLYKLTGTSLFGYVVTNGAFTPAANSETFTLRVRSFAP